MKLFQRYDNEVNEVDQKSRLKLDYTALFFNRRKTSDIIPRDKLLFIVNVSTAVLPLFLLCETDSYFSSSSSYDDKLS